MLSLFAKEPEEFSKEIQNMVDMHEIHNLVDQPQSPDQSKLSFSPYDYIMRLRSGDLGSLDPE